MKVIHVLPHMDREASGPGYSVPKLCDALGRRGHDVTLVTLKRQSPLRGGQFEHRSYPLTLDFGRLGVSEPMRHGLAQLAASADIIHSHGLWMMPNLYPAWAAASAKKPLVVAPRGTLSPVARARSRWRKRLMWWLAQRRAVAGAACLHATSEQEYSDIRGMGFNQPVTVVPNGVDIAERFPIRRPSATRRRLLYLGRVHPIKGLPMLLQAWRTLELQFPDWELRIVGPDSEGHLGQLQRLSADLDLKNISFQPASYGKEKSEEYWAADLYVLPSFSENFGMSVAEALAHGVPVVTTWGTPWRGVEDRRCGWWVSPTVSDLTAGLSTALKIDGRELSQMGRRGQRWMSTEFSWDHIAKDMEATYHWIIGGGAPAASIRAD